MSIDNHKSGAGKSHPSDYTLYLPDECLAFIFQTLLLQDDRNNCSLVCRLWLRVEGQTRRRLTLSLNGSTQSDIIPSIPSIFARFDSITELSLKGGCLLGDEALILISLECKNLTRLTLDGCEITADGVEALLKNCLKELHLQQVSVRKPIGSGAASTSLKVICLDKIDNFDVKIFAPLIKASKSLRTLKLMSLGWLGFLPLDALLQYLANSVTEIHMEKVVVSNIGLSAISCFCPNLEILRLVKFFGNCSDAGIVMLAKRCKSLKNLHINDFWFRRQTNELIWDEGLMAVAGNCPNQEELVLDGVRVTQMSLGMLGANCDKLERLTLCASMTVRDAELKCIAAKCNALKKLWIEYCRVSDRGIQALASGCPNLAQVMFRECKEHTLKGVHQLRASRASLVVDFDEVGSGRAKRPLKQFAVYR